MDTALILEQAIDTGEVLKVKYHGGSCPGALREIAPIKLSGEKVRARCYTSNAVKVFMVEKLEVVDYETAGQDWDEYGGLPAYKSLRELYEDKESWLSGLGWAVEFDDEDQDAQYLTLHRRFKNGRVVKSAAVGLCYEKYRYESAFELNADTGETIENWVQIERVRCWTVFGNKIKTNSYGSLAKSAPFFIQLAESQKK